MKETDELTDISEVTPLALANIGLDLIGESSILETMMKKAVAGIKQ